MTDPLLAPTNTRAHVLIGCALAAATVATFISGRLAVSVFASALFLVAYFDLRRLLAPVGHPLTFVLGAIGATGLLACGYAGRLQLMPSVAAALVLVLLTTRVLLNEAGAKTDVPMTADVAATIAAAATVGALGAHVLLIRAMRHIGVRALLVFGLMVLLNDVAAFAAGRLRGRRRLAQNVSPQKTWEGALAGAGASIAVGLAAGVLCDPPFTLTSGLAFGAGTAVLAPIGDLAFSAIKRSAGVRHAGSYLGPLGGALDVVDSVLFVAPAFYWALRTIAL